MEWTQEKIFETIATITADSAVNPELRKLALENPSKAVEQVAGFPLPEGVTMKFVENEGMTYTIGLPKTSAADGELSDDELLSVAGGVGKMRPGYPGYPGGGQPSRPANPPSSSPAPQPGMPPRYPGSKRF